MRTALIILCLLASSAFAKNSNFYQPPKPFDTNTRPRLGITPVPTPLPVALVGGGNMSLTNATTTNSLFSTSGNNRLLFVGVAFKDNINCSTCTASISAFTYAGQALTRLNTNNFSGPVTNELWYRKAPTSGSNSLAVTFTDVVDGVIGVGVYSDVNQTATFGPVSCINATSTTPSITIGSSVGRFINDNLSVNIPGATTITEDQTLLWKVTVGPGGSQVAGAGSVKDGGGPVTMSWTLSVSRAWGLCAVEILN